MKNSSDLILVALKLLGCNQKTLAEKLEVSATQITKWKGGEYMSIDMREKIESMLDLKGMPPNMVMMAGSVESATEWMSLVYHLADIVSGMAETGYVTTPLIDEFELKSLGWSTFFTLEQMGVALPSSFPDELKNIAEIYNNDSEISEAAHELVINNPYASIIYRMYLKLNDVYGFYVAYIKELMNNEALDLFDTAACNIEACLMDLAASKLNEEDTALATNFPSFRFKVNKDFSEWLMIIKLTAIQHNIPLRAELLDMVSQSGDTLGCDAERESLGFNKNRLHPDVYMNELLIGMREIRLVLPHILNKLGIDENSI